MASLASETVGVSWRGFGTYLCSSCKDLYETREEEGDITLVCEEEFIKAHKIVLFIGSSYFRNILKSMPCTHPTILLKGISPTLMNSILLYLYKGEVIIDQDNLEKFLETSEELGICGIAPEQLVQPKLKMGCPPKLRYKQVARSMASSESESSVSEF